MSQARNLAGSFVPIREARTTSLTTLGALNAEVVLDVSGDESALINVVGTSPVMTLEFTGSVDGSNFFAIPAYLLAGTGGTIQQAPLAFVTDTLAATNTLRVYAVRAAQLAKVRVRVSAYTSGSVSVIIRSDSVRNRHDGISDRVSSPLLISTTGAASAAVTATLPAVAGLRHYIDRISVVRSATAALTAAATPVVVTTTNIPGSLALTFGSDAGGIGLDKEVVMDFGGAGLATTAVNTATTIVCPVYTGVIWRVNVSYRLGI